MSKDEQRMEMIKKMQRFRKINMSVLFQPLTRGEFFTLEKILAHREDNLRSGAYVWELAEKLNVSPPAVSRMLRTMEKQGWIERVVEQSDRRNTLVTATAEGQEICHRISIQLDTFADNAIEAMGENEMNTFLLLWDRLICRMETEIEKQKKEITDDKDNKISQKL